METKRLVNPGAEERLDQEIQVLDKGYIILRDYMGTDASIVAAARVSYNKDARLDDEQGNAKLINYLMQHRHTSPFEQAILTFDIKAPIFVFREMIRHRTASLNEISGRYAVLPEELYVPELSRVQKQSSTNKQGSGEPLGLGLAEDFLDLVEGSTSASIGAYHTGLNLGVAKELARIVLPLSTYSRMRWSCDLHNIMHFLKLRLAPGAQYEIRVLAQAMADIVASAFPLSWAAFDEYVLGAVTLSRTEVETLRALLCSLPDSDRNIGPVKKLLTQTT